MAAPTYTLRFVKDLHGDRVPKVVQLLAAANLETKKGTLLHMASGEVNAGGTSLVAAVGLAVAPTEAALSQGDPVMVELIAPGFLYEVTADADATSLAGFNGKTVDFNADGSLDVGDASNGSFSVLRVENSGLRAYGVFTVGAMF